MSKFVKEMLITEIRERLNGTRDLLIVDASRLDAVTDNQFRSKLAERDISILQVKNSLARKALAENDVTSLDDILQGPSTLVWGGEDIVALSKEITRWTKQIDALEIKGASVDGTRVDAAGVESLSKSPGRLELIGQIAGLMLSPGAQLAGALLGPGGKLAGQIKAIADKDEEEGGE